MALLDLLRRMASKCWEDSSCYEDGGRGVDTMVEHEIAGLAEAQLDEECSRGAGMSFNNVDLQVRAVLVREHEQVASHVCLTLLASWW